MILKTHHSQQHHHQQQQKQQQQQQKQANKHKNNDVKKCTQPLPEDTTSTVPSVVDKQKTVIQYIRQEEGTGEFELSTRKAIPTLHCVCESAQTNNHNRAGGHIYCKICTPVNA